MRTGILQSLGETTGLILAIPINGNTPLSATQCLGQVVYSTGANTVTLPISVAGMSVTIYAVTAAIQTIAPGTGKRIILNGVSLGDNVSMTSDGTIGALVTLHSDSASGWVVVGKSGTWS